MAGFYIKKVIAKSAAKGDAGVSFGKGLTIIQGRSDSGKTGFSQSPAWQIVLTLFSVAPWTSRLRRRQNMTA